MKILSLVSYTIFPAKIGGQKGIALFNEYLAKECELICVTVKSNKPGFAKNYTIKNILSDSSFRYLNLFYFFTLRKIIKQDKITHFILEHPYYGWLGILLKWSTAAKMVVHSHNMEAVRWKSLGKWWWKILWWYEKVTHRTAHYNFFIHDDDRHFAIKSFGLKKEKCTTVTYGIEWDKSPTPDEKILCRKFVAEQHGIDTEEKIFLFNGTLDYMPNLQAVKIIVEKINPLLQASSLKYKIIVCGRGLPIDMNNLKDYLTKNIIYAGFVEDITVYFKGADVFINPVIEGGGIKTKLVEAIGYSTPAVSTITGAIGVNQNVTGELLSVVDDGDWEQFAQKVIDTHSNPGITPDSFYQEFYWKNIIKKAAEFIAY